MTTPARVYRYTAFVAWAKMPGYLEEIDVDAHDSVSARTIAEMELARFYEPGGKIVRIEERFGLYF